MANVVIDDSSLYAIGDALREKLGESHIEQVYVETIHHPEITKDMEPRIAKTKNATGFDTFSGGYGNSISGEVQNIIIEGAANLIVTVAYQTESTNYDYLRINGSTTKYGGTTLTKKEIAIAGNSVSFSFTSDSSSDNYLGYYAEVLGFDADGHLIQEVVPAWDEDIYEDVVVPHIYKPRDMADAIVSIKGKLKYVTLTRRDAYSFDLSPYVSDGDDFILYFTQHMSTTTSSSVYSSMYTTFFTEEERLYKHRLAYSTYNKDGISKWSDSAGSTENTKAIALHLTDSSTKPTNYESVTLTYENGILTNSVGVGTSAILVYAD